MWKHKLLFVETPDAMETSIALKNYREVGESIADSADVRRVIMVVEQSCFRSPEERCPRVLISITTMAGQ